VHPVITIHHLNNSRSQRVLWLLEELGVPYEIVKYERDAKTMLAPKSLEAIHPLGKSPVITDDGKTIAESGAILEYLVETYGKGKFAPPPGTQAFQDYRYFMHYAEGSLMPFLLMKLVFNKIKSDAPFIVRPIAKAIAGKVGAQFLDPNLRRHFKFLNDHLAKHAWFAGDELSAADAQMLFPVEAAVQRGADLADVSQLASWLEKVKQRPAYAKAIERGGPYDLVG
jgi:glutathione S-transferase